MNKYQLFFSSFKEFVIQIKLSKLDDLCGIKDSEISSFEATYNIKIPKSVISFFQIMGKKMNIRNNQYGIFTISEFIKGMEVSNKLNLYKYINKSENSNKYVYFSIDRIQEDYIYFFDSQEENPKVFLQWDLMDDEDYQDCYG